LAIDFSWIVPRGSRARLLRFFQGEEHILARDLQETCSLDIAMGMLGVRAIRGIDLISNR